MKDKTLFRRLFTSSLFLSAVMLSWAYDFAVDGIYYNSLGDQTAEVTYSSWKNNSYASLTSITIPASVTYQDKNYIVTGIHYDAFKSCSKLTSVSIPESMISIGSTAFASCSSLTNINIPESVTSIGEAAFSGCTSLPVEGGLRYADTYLVEAVDKDQATYTIKEGTRFINSSTFSYCSKLTSISIPKSVIWVGQGAFYGCTSLPVIDDIRYADTYLIEVVDKTKSEYAIKEGTRFVEASAFIDCSNLTSINIPEGVVNIGSQTFMRCSALTSVTIPEGVTTIGSSAFQGCSNLTSVTLPESVTTIGSSIFSGCYCLAFVNIPENVESIPNSCFYGCGRLKSINIPNSVTSIGNYAFSNTGFTSFSIGNNVKAIGEGAFSGCSNLTSVTISNGAIGSSAFEKCYNLVSVSIGQGVGGIGKNAFFLCNSLTKAEFASIENLCMIWFEDNYSNPLSHAHHLFINGEEVTDLIIPESITNLPRYTFYGCSSLKSVTFPSGMKSIGLWAFWGCSGLESLTIPESVTDIGQAAFYYCSGLTSISVDANNNRYDSRNNCNAIIETSNNALLYGCKNTVIPDGVTQIGGFRNCTDLTSITIPGSVWYIDGSSFEGCTNLRYVTCLASTVPSSSTNPFTYVTLNYATLYVPAESLEAYKAANYWKEFGTILPINIDAIDNLTADDSKTDVSNNEPVFDLIGRRLQQKPAGGFYIRNGRKYLAH